MPEWNAVSKQATAGTPGRIWFTASNAASDFGWWSGARSVRARRRATTSGPIRTGPTNSVPPWTMRWPTASTAPKPSTDRAVPASSAWPCGAGRSAAAVTRSSSSRSRSFRLVDPALTTSIRMALVGPGPAADLRIILAGRARVGASKQTPVAHLLPNVSGPGGQTGHPVDHVHHQVETIQVIQHDHVKWRGGGALLLVPADVEVGVIRPPVGQPVDERRIAVVGEHHRATDREERVEL